MSCLKIYLLQLILAVSFTFYESGNCLNISNTTESISATVGNSVVSATTNASLNKTNKNFASVVIDPIKIKDEGR